jgi:hypothetical protein
VNIAPLVYLQSFCQSRRLLKIRFAKILYPFSISTDFLPLRNERIHPINSVVFLPTKVEFAPHCCRQLCSTIFRNHILCDSFTKYETVYLFSKFISYSAFRQLSLIASNQWEKVHGREIPTSSWEGLFQDTHISGNFVYLNFATKCWHWTVRACLTTDYPYCS